MAEEGASTGDLLKGGAGAESECSEKGIDHAWQWFEYHAGQRIAMMRFAITTLGGVAAATGLLQQQAQHGLSVLVALLGVVLSYCFYKFDFRVKTLVKLGERALASEQAKLAKSTLNDHFNICVNADKLRKGPLETYSQILRLIYGSVGTLFLLYCLIEALHSKHAHCLILHIGCPIN